MNSVRILTSACVTVFLAAVASGQGSWTPTGRLLPAEGYGATDNQFGAALSVHGNQALVGSPGIDGELGRAYLFERQGSSWIQQAWWKSTDIDDEFGSAVALSADTILVGAPEYLDESGSVHILTLQDGEWVHADALGWGAPQADALLGAAVADTGDTAFVGAPGRGGVHVLERSAGTWFYAGQLLASAEPQDGFGEALAFDGVRLLVGSPDDEAVHVFESTGLPAGSGTYTAAWVETARLLPSAGIYGDFGETVALLGNTALIGAPEEDGLGAAFVFELDSMGWAQTFILTPTDSPLGSEFGSAVALGEGLALVGAPVDYAAPGLAYVFKRTGSSWFEKGRLVPEVGPGESRVGYNVAVTGRTLMVNVGLDDSPIFGVYAGSINTWEPSKPIRKFTDPGGSVILRR
jgi:hypothetical protein